MSITLFIGPMYAGKSSSVLNILESVPRQRALLIKYSGDTRYTERDDTLITHDGRLYTGPNVCATKDLLEANERVITMPFHSTVAIDEFQFFETPMCVVQWAAAGYHIYVAALDGDYMSHMFENVSLVLPYANIIQKLAARCNKCGKHNAIVTRRTTNARERVVIGGEGMYVALCRACSN
jgi:thymidine kinase